MKKQILFFIAALTFLFCGNSQAQNACKFSEPKDSVAKIIWEKLKNEDECISKVIAGLEKIDKKICLCNFFRLRHNHCWISYYNEKENEIFNDYPHLT